MKAYSTLQRQREDGHVLLSISRGVTLLHAPVRVTDGVGKQIGLFKSKLFSIGGGFHVLDELQQPVAEIKGDWKGWNFRFLTSDGSEIGKVTKKWAGLGKELFTSADNYIIALSETAAIRPEAAPLLLAAGLAIDTVFKEKRSRRHWSNRLAKNVSVPATRSNPRSPVAPQDRSG